jgi:hypothetical protein
MSRLTYTGIRNAFGFNVGKPAFTDTNLGNFFDSALGQRYQQIQAELTGYKTQPPPKTAATVANQQYY